MEAQGEFRAQHHKDWKGNEEQTDDITLIGIRL